MLMSEITGNSSTSSKVVELSSFGNPKEFFHPASKKLGCAEEMVRDRMSLSECRDAREYCDSIMQRYIVVLDNATFIPCEHIQKEKEYGIIWRSAFKAELQTLINDVAKKLM